MKHLTLIIGLLITLRSAGATWVPPIGIPDPRWGDTLHPITTEKPDPPQQWPAEPVVGYYYVDSDHPTATDTSNPFGYPEYPRRTIPATLAAGSKVFVTRCATNLVLANAIGIVTNPVWIIGTGAALYQTGGQGTAITVTGASSYVIIDGIVMDGTGASDRTSSAAFYINAGADHICVRNCTVRNYVPGYYDEARTTSAWYGALDSVNSDNGDVSHVVFYNFNCSNNCGGRTLDYESGRHGLIITGSVAGTYTTSNIWVLDSTISNNSEDAIQIGKTSASTVRTACTNIYIGRNVMSQNGENAVDLKACDKIVVSQNTFHDYKSTIYRPGASSGSDGAAGVINDDGQGPLESWWLFNHFSECRVGIRNQSTGGKHFIVGNIAQTIHLNDGTTTSVGSARGVFYHHDNQTTDGYIVNNTIYDVEGGIYLNNVKYGFVWGNIVCGIRALGWPINVNNVAATGGGLSVGDNIYFDPGTPIRRDANALSVANGDLLDVNPELISPPANMGLSLSSPARNATVEAAVYATFEAIYGRSIRYDFNGSPRPSSGPWDVGAIQASGVSAKPLAAPGKVKVDPLPNG